MRKFKKYKGRNRHHLKPRCRKGKTRKENLLLIKEDRHHSWHTLFGGKTLTEVIDLLIRLKRIKGYKE